MTKLLLTIEEAGEAIGLGRSKMYELITAGEIEAVKIGKARRVPAEALAAYVARLRSTQVEAQPA